MTPAALHAAIDRSRAPGEQLYAVADAARDPELARAGFERFKLERYTLFPATIHPQMPPVGPYLIPVPFGAKYPFPDAGYFDLWAGRFGRSCGVLLTTAADLRTIWEHLRGVFLVEDERGTEFFFRFYDPRVLRDFFPSLTVAEAKQFFGPVKRFFAESDGGAELLVARPGEKGAIVERRAPTG
jgi:hypothetical protein